MINDVYNLTVVILERMAEGTHCYVIATLQYTYSLWGLVAQEKINDADYLVLTYCVLYWFILITCPI